MLTLVAGMTFTARAQYRFEVREIDFDKIDRTRGMDITIVTTAPTDEEGKALLDAFHFPFKAE